MFSKYKWIIANKTNKTNTSRSEIKLFIFSRNIMKSPLSFLPLSVFYDILKTYSFKEPYHKLYVIIVVSKQFPMIISLSPIRVLIDQIMYSIGDIGHFGERMNEERKGWLHIWSDQTRRNRRGESGSCITRPSEPGAGGRGDPIAPKFVRYRCKTLSLKSS